jgi:Ca2+-dependent lipid-binding protein
MTTFNGTISFTITAAKKLPDTDRISFNLWENDLTDPFVEIEIDGHELFRTKHVDNCLDPVWESENTYEHKVNGEIKEILIKIKDKEAIGSVNVCGKCFDGEDLKAFAKKKTTEGWFDLRNESGKGEYLADAQVQLIMKYNHELIGKYVSQTLIFFK